MWRCRYMHYYSRAVGFSLPPLQPKTHPFKLWVTIATSLWLSLSLTNILRHNLLAEGMPCMHLIFENVHAPALITMPKMKKSEYVSACTFVEIGYFFPCSVTLITNVMRFTEWKIKWSHGCQHQPASYPLLHVYDNTYPSNEHWF